MTELDRIRWQFDLTWSLLTLHLDQLTDEDALWEPVPNCWTVRPRPDGTWTADFSMEELDPIPLPTIGWVMWHMGMWWENAYAGCFGDGASADWAAVAAATTWPGDVRSAVTSLTGHHDRWRAALDALSDADLDATDRTTWFAEGGLTLGHVLAWANVELMKNAAEIGSLRLQRANLR
ncbi:DinB family protein [Nonomuraea sp. NPDC049725]|uniref:DinB family protein n=1 Tax=Nonomuraea sp. NPDC049725 TaxID=3154508 RepID=UPI00343EFCFB